MVSASEIPINDCNEWATFVLESFTHVEKGDPMGRSDLVAISESLVGDASPQLRALTATDSGLMVATAQPPLAGEEGPCVPMPAPEGDRFLCVPDKVHGDAHSGFAERLFADAECTHPVLPAPTEETNLVSGDLVAVRLGDWVCGHGSRLSHLYRVLGEHTDTLYYSYDAGCVVARPRPTLALEPIPLSSLPEMTFGTAPS